MSLIDFIYMFYLCKCMSLKTQLKSCSWMPAGWVGENMHQQSIFICIFSLASLHSPLWWWWWWAQLLQQVYLASVAQDAALAWDVTHCCGKTWWCILSHGLIVDLEWLVSSFSSTSNVTVLVWGNKWLIQIIKNICRLYKGLFSVGSWRIYFMK